MHLLRTGATSKDMGWRWVTGLLRGHTGALVAVLVLLPLGRAHKLVHLGDRHSAQGEEVAGDGVEGLVAVEQGEPPDLRVLLKKEQRKQRQGESVNNPNAQKGQGDRSERHAAHVHTTQRTGNETPTTRKFVWDRTQTGSSKVPCSPSANTASRSNSSMPYESMMTSSARAIPVAWSRKVGTTPSLAGTFGSSLAEPVTA